MLRKLCKEIAATKIINSMDVKAITMKRFGPAGRVVGMADVRMRIFVSSDMLPEVDDEALSQRINACKE